MIRGGYGLYFQKTAYSNFTPIVFVGRDVQLVHRSIVPDQQRRCRVRRTGRLPTDPFLVNGPVVNRALLNQLYPAGTTTKNTGTVRFDNPDRHLPYSHQASIGFEKQLIGNIAVSADYVHASHRDLYMLQELNPGIRATTARTAAVARDIPDSAVQRWGARTRQRGHVRLQRPADQHPEALQQPLPGARVVHLLARPTAPSRAPGATDSITTYTTDPVTKVSDQHLDDRNAMGDQDRPHILSLSGAVEVPHTKGLNLSGVWQYNSGTPFTLTDSNTDPNRNGIFEEPLPAGTYSGAATNANAITRREQGRLQRRARPGLLARRASAPRIGSSCPATATAGSSRLRRRVQRHESRELQQPDRRSSRRRDVPDPALDPQRRPEPDGAVQREVRLSQREGG